MTNIKNYAKNKPNLPETCNECGKPILGYQRGVKCSMCGKPVCREHALLVSQFTCANCKNFAQSFEAKNFQTAPQYQSPVNANDFWENLRIAENLFTSDKKNALRLSEQIFNNLIRKGNK